MKAEMMTAYAVAFYSGSDLCFGLGDTGAFMSTYWDQPVQHQPKTILFHFLASVDMGI